MKLADACIRRPVTSWMILVTFIVFGILGYTRLGSSMMPEVDFPMLNVMLSWEGAEPESMEKDVVEVIEDAAIQVEGIKKITSAVHRGSANVLVELDISRDLDAAFQELQSRISQVRNRLPLDLDPPVIMKMGISQMPLAVKRCGRFNPAIDSYGIGSVALRNSVASISFENV